MKQAPVLSIQNKDSHNERPQTMSAVSSNHATSSQSGGPGKGKGNKKGKAIAKKENNKRKMKKKVSMLKNNKMNLILPNYSQN